MRNEYLLGDYHFKYLDPNIGYRLYRGDSYIGNYMTLEECACDLVFRFGAGSVDEINNIFKQHNISIQKPYLFRGVCSELFLPFDTISRYIHHSNSLPELISKMDVHEQRANNQPNYFLYGVQGSGIHIYSFDKNEYVFWTTIDSCKSTFELLLKAHDEHSFIQIKQNREETIPIKQTDNIDVFISHKSDDYNKAKELYDYLTSKGLNVFLSEISLPASRNTDYSYEIDSSLDMARNMVVLVTSDNVLLSGWVRYEYTAFANEKRSGRKSGNLITLLVDNSVNVDKLPLLLRQYQVLNFSQLNVLYDYLA